MLDTITHLAREKSSDKRRELLGRVADLFFIGAEHHSKQEAIIFRDIVLKMLEDVDLDGRTAFSQQVAAQDALPREVARALAQDAVEVASPMLQNSPVLTDEDFVEFSSALSPSHLESIAKRDYLSGMVTDALIEHGNREVLHKVTQNQGAEITPHGFNRLVDKATGDQILQESLIARPDMTQEAAENLVPLLPPESRARLTTLFRLNAQLAGELVGQAQRKAIEQQLAGRNGRLETKLLISDIKEGKVSLSVAIGELAGSGRTADMILLIASIAELDEPVVSNAFYQASDEPITILCKSLDVTLEGFTALMRVRCAKLSQPLSEAGRSIARYKDLDISSSQRAMRFVQMRKNLNKAG